MPPRVLTSEQNPARAIIRPDFNDASSGFGAKIRGRKTLLNVKPWHVIFGNPSVKGRQSYQCIELHTHLCSTPEAYQLVGDMLLSIPNSRL